MGYCCKRNRHCLSEYCLNKMTCIRNDLFDSARGYNRGRGVGAFLLWQLIKWLFFKTVFPWPSSLKVALLRIFGAKMGKNICLKPQVNIHLPWKLEVGDFAWIGEEVYILNFEKIYIGPHVCISQRAFLCGGNHDFRDHTMPYRNGPITVEGGAWIGAQTFIAPNITIAEEAIVTAGSVVLRNMPRATICSGNPCVPLKPRWKNN